MLHDGYPLVYVRGGRYLVVVNPRSEAAETAAPAGRATAVEARGVTVAEGRIRAEGFGFGVFALDAG